MAYLCQGELGNKADCSRGSALGHQEIRLFTLLASPICRWAQSSVHLQPEFPLRPFIPSTPSSFP